MATPRLYSTPRDGAPLCTFRCGHCKHIANSVRTPRRHRRERTWLWRGRPRAIAGPRVQVPRRCPPPLIASAAVSVRPSYSRHGPASSRTAHSPGASARHKACRPLTPRPRRAPTPRRRERERETPGVAAQERGRESLRDAERGRGAGEWRGGGGGRQTPGPHRAPLCAPRGAEVATPPTPNPRSTHPNRDPPERGRRDGDAATLGCTPLGDAMMHRGRTRGRRGGQTEETEAQTAAQTAAGRRRRGEWRGEVCRADRGMGHGGTAARQDGTHAGRQVQRQRPRVLSAANADECSRRMVLPSEDDGRR